jgi:DNA-directed RNA polymerase specialized sigma24 family protein
VEGVGDLLEMLNRLTPMQRGAFVLRVVFDQPSGDAERALGISEIACRVHLHGARVRLRRLLEEVELI